MTNLISDLPTKLPDELVTVLAESEHVRIERIVSTGHASDENFWYDQSEAEWVVVLQGEAKLMLADGPTQKLTPGDYLLIPPHQKHRVEWTSPDQPTVWLAVFFRETESSPS